MPHILPLSPFAAPSPASSVARLSRASRPAGRRCLGLLFALLLATSADSATTVEISAEASRAAANDLARATVAAEATAATPGEVAREVNRLIAEALKASLSYPIVKTRSAGSHTYPVYAPKGGRIEGWRMRSELLLESGDAAALAECLGRLQSALAVSSLSLAPSPETRRSAEDAATVEAIAAFKARAQLVAETFGQRYTIKELTIGSGDRSPPAPLMRSFAAPGAEAMTMPIEAGESRVTVRVSGRIVVGD